jgi:hypothetical protein
MPPISSLSTKVKPFLSDKHLPAGFTVTTGRKTFKTISEKSVIILGKELITTYTC